jgi:alkylated DNA nucleotide flippase Atl1
MVPRMTVIAKTTRTVAARNRSDGRRTRWANGGSTTSTRPCCGTVTHLIVSRHVSAAREDVRVPQEIPIYAERVLDVVDRVPRGKVVTYGDVAGLLGEGSGRTVGRVMASYGGAVAWWRVVLATGRPAPGHESEALRRLRLDGVPLRDNVRVDLGLARWLG